VELGCRPFREERISGSDELNAGHYFYLLGAFAAEYSIRTAKGVERIHQT